MQCLDVSFISQIIPEKHFWENKQKQEVGQAAEQQQLWQLDSVFGLDSIAGEKRARGKLRRINLSPATNSSLWKD